MKNLKQYLPYFIVFLTAIVLYSNTFDHDYAWDDAIVITENERVQKGLEDIPSFFQNIKSHETQHRYGYRPITLLSFAADIEMFGQNPRNSHIMNVVLYGILCVVLLISIRMLFPKKGKLFGYFIVALFLVHPLHVEVVANIKSRDEILSMLFGLLSVIGFIWFLEKEKTQKIVGAAMTIICLLLSFLSKENGITFVGVLVLVAFYKLNITKKQLKLFLIPVVGLVLLLLVRQLSFSEGVFDENTAELIDRGVYFEDPFIGNPLSDADNVFEIIPSTFYILLKDVGLLLVPYPLVHDYSYSTSQIESWSNPFVWLGIILVGFLIYVAVKGWKEKTSLSFGIFFFFISISIYLHLFGVGPDYMADRFLFVASLGFCIALVSVIEWLIKTPLESFSTLALNQKTKMSGAGFGIVFLLFAYMTIDRNKAWENTLTLLETDIEHLDDNARANYNLAAELHIKYYNSPYTEQDEIRDRMIKHYERSVEISDRAIIPIMDLGSVYMEFGYLEKGKEMFILGTKNFPELSIPYLQLGRYYISQEEYLSAEESIEKALERGAKNADSYYLLSIAKLKLDNLDGAVNALADGEPFAEENFQYFELYSDLLMFQGDTTLSAEKIEVAFELNPGSPTIQEKYNSRVLGN